MKTVTADKLSQEHSTEFRGLPVIIEWPKGSTRVGERPDGTTFKTEMKADYGYIPDTTAAGDKEKLDIYVGPDEDAEYAYIVEQLDEQGEFDEYKIMLGFDSLDEAEDTYLEHVDEKLLGDIGEVDFEYLFDTVKEKQKAAAEKKEAAKAKEGSKLSADKYTLIEAFLKNYKHEVDFYEEVAELVEDKLSEALQGAGIKAVVSSRAKSPDRLKKKLYKRDKTKQYKTFLDIYGDIVDLAGCRVALYMPADRDIVGQIIEKLFAPVRPPKQFPEDGGPEDGLGYVATHYLVTLRPETLRRKELRYADTRIEIQVASVLMHAWSEVTHDLLYKPEKGELTPEEKGTLNNLNVLVQEGERQLEKLQSAMEGRTRERLRFDIAAGLADDLKARSTKQASALTLASFKNAVQAIITAGVEHVIDPEAIKTLVFEHRPFSETNGRMEIKGSRGRGHRKEIIGYIEYLMMGDKFKVTRSHVDADFMGSGIKLAAIERLQKVLDCKVEPSNSLRVMVYRDSASGSTRGLSPAKPSLWASYMGAVENLKKSRWSKTPISDPETRKAWEAAGVKGDETHFIHEAMNKLCPGKPYNSLWALPSGQRQEVIDLAQKLKFEARKKDI